jgi:hypothetical protein
MRIVDSLTSLFRTFEYRQPRLQVRIPVWLQFPSVQSGLVPAICVDISEDGMGADIEQAFEIGSSATLILPSDSRPDPFIIPVQVVSRHEQRHGFRFVPARTWDVQEIAAALRAVADGAARREPAKLPTLEEKRKAV